MPPPPPPGAAGARVSAAPELRRHLLRMVFGVILLDAAFLALKDRLAVDAWPSQRRLLFTAAWMLATVAIVGTSLARIRVARQRARQLARSARIARAGERP